MKKVTLQEIANSLGISRTTVWKVFSGHEGVSDSLRTKVIAKAQELGYAIPEDFQYPSQAENTTPVNIAVAVCRPETSLFWMTIIHQIAKVFSAHNVNLPFLPVPYAGRICLCQRLRCLHSDAAAGETWSSHTGGYCGIRLRQHHRGSSRRRPDNRTGFQRGSRCTSGASDSVPDQTSTQAARNYVS